MWRTIKLVLFVGLGLTAIVFVKLISLLQRQPVSYNEGFEHPNDENVKGKATETVDQQCLGISSRWSIIFNPSKIGGKTNFPLINPHTEPKLTCDERFLDIIVTVNSGADSPRHRALRQAIRQTWANTSSSNNNPTSARWRLFFALGVANQVAENNLNIKEVEKNNDIIIGKFSDTYRNIPIKTFMSHLWAFSKFSFKYILKTDDDVYARVPVLHQWLVRQGSPRSFHGGHVKRVEMVVRDPRNKWYISYEQFNESKWPDFCHGAFQVLSIDLIPAYLYYTQIHKPFHADDAFLGVIARDLGIHVTDIPGTNIVSGVPTTDCKFSQAIAIGHNIKPNTMFTIEETYKRLARQKIRTCV